MRPTCNKYQRFVTKEFVCVLFYIFFDIVIMIELFFRSKLNKYLHFITLMIIGSSLAASTSIAQVSEPLTSHSDKYQTNEKPSRNLRRLLSYISRRTIVTIRQELVQVATTVAWDRTFSKENYRFLRKCRTHILQMLPKLVFKKPTVVMLYLVSVWNGTGTEIKLMPLSSKRGVFVELNFTSCRDIDISIVML